MVHAFRGKEFVEYDNPYDVGMTGLLGFSSGYRAMEHCDVLVMLGTDFRYRPFLPTGVPVIQVDVRGERIGRRLPVQVPLVGTVRDTVDALLPLLEPKTDSAAGIVNWGTDLDNPDFAGIARAAGLFGVRVDKADELEDALKAAFAHDGPALVDVRTARHELSVPPKVTYNQVKGFSLYATRTILSGEGSELIELAKTNLRELAVE